ncbi:hypothetical protein [Mycobacteroides chelonae]|uniref:hypothetical protein n=1 Tax=Mycobacteroides chelonae TaxID=1774 RepID=UPI0008A97B5F|nr:hypothetical protein [Mycobacteroides chelonae]OHU12930.1 hypothetical protein BKG75_18135 [Mycobacteroides chelonae]
MNAQVVVDALYVVAAVLVLLALAVVLTIWRGPYIEQAKRPQVKLALIMLGVSTASGLLAAVAGIATPDVHGPGWAQYLWIASLAVLGLFVLFRRLRTIAHQREQWRQSQADQASTSVVPQENPSEGQH